MRRESPRWAQHPAPTEPVDLNILPEEYRPRVLPSYVRSMWVAGVGLLLVAVVLLIMGQMNRAQVRDLNDSITQVQRELDAAQTPQPELLELQDELAQVVAAIASVQTVYPRGAEERRDWSAILGIVLQYDPELVELQELFQTGGDLTVVGLALTQEDVLQYAGQLDRSGVFERVLVQSMQRVDQPMATPPPIQLITTPLAPTTPTPLTPAASPTPIAPATAVATPTGTRMFYDEYEIDDFEYKPIAIGEVQHRNFNPMHDRDRATFLGLAGYRYCIRAVPQAPAVHPVLTVSMGSVGQHVRQSDSCQPAHLDPACRCPAGVPEAATMAITIDTPYDQGVWIDLTNEGRFGPDSWYTLEVVVIATAPEATPTPPLWLPASPTPVGEPAPVTATATPWPPFGTLTPTPSPAPGTPTPDPQCADAYEPDDIVGRPIIPGVGQLRTFCPVGDIDRAVFTAKHGHRYRVETLALSPGVDTELSVLLAGQTYTSRDRSPHDLSSMVEVTNRSGADAPAFITITNHGVFGPTRFYTLLVTDLGVIDLYEPDDWSGVEILPSEPQSRVFYPQGDVDKVFFVARPHTVYHIYTSDLAPGVDTVLTVDRPRRIVNDNARPGVLYSSIEFENTSSEPVRVDVTITNKGQFGPDKRYTITVAEMGAGDPYEVDDVHGVPIEPNTSQARTFYPEGDVDKVFFTARAAHRYAIYTEQLSPGVDTVLSATMGTQMVSNDNRGPGDLSSYLELWNDTPNDLQATVTVTNRGQYGLDKRYVLWVRDLGAEGLDEYEPDLTILRPIVLDVVQRRNFFPAGDIDRAVLGVTAGERYAVLTCGSADLPPLPIASTEPFVPFDLRCAPLGPGVDTVLVVSGPIRRCHPEGCQSVNVPQDEFATYTNSRVEFDAVQDGQVTIMIYNRGTFGVHQVYYLRAHRIDPLPTPTPSVAPYPSPGAGLSPGGGDTGDLIAAHDSPSWIMPASYLASRPLLAPLRALGSTQVAEPGPASGNALETIRFTLLLRMRPTSP